MVRLFKNLSRFCRSRRLRDLVASPGEDQLDLQHTHRNPASPGPASRASTDTEASTSSSQKYWDLALKLRPSFPQACRWLETSDLQDMAEKPFSGGRYAEVRKADLDGREVAVKSYRMYLRFDFDQVCMRFFREAQAYNLLSHRNILPFVGIYSTLKDPFSLVFEYVRHVGLTEYIRSTPNAGKLELVTGTARGLHHMHDMGVVHGNLEITNVLVDSEDTPRIGGLGSVFVETSSLFWSEDPYQFTRCSAPELVNPEAFGLCKAQVTKASDIFAFGMLAYQVFSGNRVFPNLSDAAAVSSMQDGSRPPRPDDPELSDRVWDMIKQCWENMPSQRITIADAVSVLEAELRQIRWTSLP